MTMIKKLITLLFLNSVLLMNAQWNGTTTLLNVGIGTSDVPNTKLQIVGSSQVGHEIGTLKLKSGTANQFLYMGYDDNFSAGFLQSVKPGIGQQDILLAPSGGNIGIGLTNPDRKLTVAGDIGINNGGVVFRNNNKFWDISSHQNDLTFNETGTSSRLFLQSGGNIGIGTITPTTKLEIIGTSQAGHEIGTLKLTSATTNQFLYMGYDDRYSAGYLQSVKPGTSQQNILIAPNGGNIGIGTYTPSYKLDVCGTIRAKEVKVDLLGGCDFVFKNDYKLMNLNDLEKFVKTKQHLPEIASEKEMIENGVNMKEFQMKLLQKIEELTLYTIEQNKRIQSLEKTVKKLKSKR